LFFVNVNRAINIYKKKKLDGFLYRCRAEFDNIWGSNTNAGKINGRFSERGVKFNDGIKPGPPRTEH
jgi:hypothetical protein